MPISRCALAVITQRGNNVVPPTLSALDADEADFLERHVRELRSQVGAADARGRFAAQGTLLGDIGAALGGDPRQFLEVAARLVDQLAEAMRGANSASCVVAIVAETIPLGPGQFTLLKLDAEIEAARLEQVGAGIRLRVFDDLLPRPGDIQKGFSWPDPRAPDSDLIVLDRVRLGSATKYFQAAFQIVASPRPRDTEAALVGELSALSPQEVGAALQAVGSGGPAERVVERIRGTVPSFHSTARELGSTGDLAGYIRPGFGASATLKFNADGIDLSVPLDQISNVTTRREGGGFITMIRTSTPLTQVVDDSGIQ